MKTKQNTIAQKMQLIKELESLSVPWHVHRLFGKSIALFGTQIAFTSDGDFANVEDAQAAVQWLVEQLDGKVTWKK